MSANTYEAENSVENEKKGTPRGHQAEVSPFPVSPQEPRKVARLAKTAVDYWKPRVRPRVLKDGTETPELYVRLKRGGREAWFNLATANRLEAARKARDLWVQVQAKGLVAVQVAMRPDPRPERPATVGELLKVAREKLKVRPSTLGQYEISLRTLTAGLLKLKRTPDVYRAGSAANVAWRTKVESARLDLFTAERITAWQEAYVAEAGTDQLARQSRENGAHATIRNARGFFSPKHVGKLRGILRLPEPLPFAGVSAPNSTRRFNTKVDPRKLYAAGLAELKDDVLTAFLLCIAGGLRRGEADMLPWGGVELARGVISIETTQWFTPKTEESKRTVPLAPDVAAYLRKLRKKRPEDDFVLRGMPPEKVRDLKDTRCACWRALRDWLKQHGFKSPNPVHELRKLSGSLIYQTAGIEAARRHLGHRDISTTAASYLTDNAAVVQLAAPVSTGSKDGGRHA